MPGLSLCNRHWNRSQICTGKLRDFKMTRSNLVQFTFESTIRHINNIYTFIGAEHMYGASNIDSSLSSSPGQVDELSIVE